MSSVDATVPSLGKLLNPEESSERFRALALLSGLLVLGSFLSVFFYITDIAGGTTWLAIVVVGSLAAATKIADKFSERTAAIVAAALFLVGGTIYLGSVPRVESSILEPDFVVAILSYTTGISVLQFLRVDLWAIALSPAPTFLTWYLLLRRRYAGAATVGAITLGFFGFTGDAKEAALLAGTIGLFGVFAFGTLERVDGSWKQVERVGLVAVLAVLATRLFSIVPEGNRGGAFGGAGGPTLEASLLSADESVQVLGSISLSPEVRFTIEASRRAYWHSGAYDRYTGDSWIRTGNADDYRSPLDPPPGQSTTVEQRVEVKTDLHSLPAAWKPIRLIDAPETDVDVTTLEGLVPSGALSSGESYAVESEVPARTPETLRAAGEAYPPEITDRYLEVPDSLPDRVAEHARAITEEAETPYEKAVAIERWLTANKSYSLEVNKPDGDIVDGFVFGMSEGYCVYFASAMAVMLRVLDVPARFAVGYTTGQQVGENQWVVRGLNSHAWVEVYFPEIGWIPFDPTPTGARNARNRQRIRRARRQNATNVDTRLSRRRGALAVETPTPTPTPTPNSEELELTVTPPTNPQTPQRTPDLPARIQEQIRGSNQSNITFAELFGTPTGTATGEETDTPTQTPRGFIGRFVAKRDRISILAGAVGLVLGAHYFGLVDRAQEELWLRSQSPTDSPVADVERAFDRLEHVLARRYREREDGESPRQYVRALQREGADVDDRIRRVAKIRERASYGGEATREEADEVISIVNDVVRDA